MSTWMAVAILFVGTMGIVGGLSAARRGDDVLDCLMGFVLGFACAALVTAIMGIVVVLLVAAVATLLGFSV